MTDSGTTQIIVFETPLSTASAICYSDPSNFPGAVTYPFTPTNDDDQPDHYTDTGSGYEYTYTPTPPPPAPDAPSFVAALTADPTIQPILVLLAPYYAAILAYGLNPAAVQLLWSQLVAQEGSGPLTPTLQATIEAYAVQFNMPLVPEE